MAALRLAAVLALAVYLPPATAVGLSGELSGFKTTYETLTEGAGETVSFADPPSFLFFRNPFCWPLAEAVG